MLSKVIFMGRGDAEDAVANPKWTVTSIATPGRSAADLQEGWRGVLRLWFKDVESGFNPEMPIFQNKDHAFTDAQAAAIWAFMDEQAPHVEGLLVHCYAGVSRSAAVAKAVAARYRLLFPAEYDSHNKFVFGKLMESLSEPR